MTHPMPEINNLIKQLKLSHINDILLQRNRESIDKKLTYPEFLSLLLQNEILDRENNKFKARIKRANVRGDKTLETFDFDFNLKINRAQIQEFASCRFVTEISPVLIVGPTGTGKSHIAQALSHCAIRQGIDVLWLSQTRLFGELQAARAAGRYEKKFSEFAKISLLIVDDFGLRPIGGCFRVMNNIIITINIRDSEYVKLTCHPVGHFFRITTRKKFCLAL